MKTSRFLALAFLLSAVICLADRPVLANDEWIQVRSKNFFLIGNASEKDIRKVATRLEQFRETFRQLFGKVSLTSSIPTNVVVFKSDSSYKEFKPKRADGKIDTGIAGYFQPGDDVNYITLATGRDDSEVFGTIFHEYVHFIINTNFGKSQIPAWFNEGLAEYYESFEIIDDQKVKLGVMRPNHLLLLRQNQLMPLDTLFNISNYQLHQSGSHSRSIFYAQSWALMHYMLQSGKQDTLGKFLTNMQNGDSPQKAFTDAFGADYAQTERDLQKYVRLSKYQYNLITFKTKLLFDSEMTVERLSPAVSNAYLGDLLYRTNRAHDAEPYLLAALKLDPDLSIANTALGMVKLRQFKFDEAKSYLERAISGDRKNHVALYRYAYLLSREGQDEFGMARNFEPATSAKMREALNQAIAINPSFTESYELLAFINLVNGVEFDESIKLLRTALRYQPGNQRYVLRIAEILARQGKLDEAAAVAEKIIQTADDAEVRRRGERLRQTVAMRRQFEDDQAKRSNNAGSGGPGRPPMLTRRSDQPAPTKAELAKLEEDANIRAINGVLRTLAAPDQRVTGHIQKISCTGGKIVYHVKTSTDTFTLTSEDFQGLELHSYHPDASNAQIGCDENVSTYHSVITYRPAVNAKTAVRGELIAVEFVPANFRIMTEDEMQASQTIIYEESDEPTGAGIESRPPPPAPRTGDTDSARRAAMMEMVRSRLRKPADNEKREIGILDKIECTKKGMFFHFRTATATRRLLSPPPGSLSITLHTPDLRGIQFGCTFQPVDYPSVFVYADKPNTKAKTDGDLVTIDLMPKSFTLD